MSLDQPNEYEQAIEAYAGAVKIRRRRVAGPGRSALEVAGAMSPMLANLKLAGSRADSAEGSGGALIKPHDAPAWWSTARAKFTKGGRVRLSATGRERHVLSARQAHAGIVVGFGRNGNTVIVRRDGRQTRESYHMDFWDLEAL